MTDTLREYAETRSPETFRLLVTAHINAVYSQCLRQLRDPAAAEDATQQVFITLAQKAATIRPGAVLGGWLFTTARYCCSTQQRSATRRRSAESKAAIMRKEVIESSRDNDDLSSQAEPILDDALAHLAASDRDALLLRFFQGRSLREVGESLGVSEDAAKQRVSRALEKLRHYFAGRGVVAPSAVIATFLTTTIKPASPAVAQAVFHAATTQSAAAYAAGMLSRSVWSLPKIAAACAIAGAIIAGVIAASHGISAQTPASASPPANPPINHVASIAPLDASPADAPATQPADQSTPLGALNKLCAAMEANDDSAISRCLCDAGKSPFTAQLGRNFVLASASAYHIEKIWTDKFGDDMRVSGLSFDTFPGGDYRTLFRGTADWPGGPEVTVDGDVARIRVPVPPDKFAGTGRNRSAAEARWSGAMLVFNRIEGDWKLNTDQTFNFVVNVERLSSNTTDETRIMGQVVRGVVECLNDVSSHIESGDIASESDAVIEIKMRISKVFSDEQIIGASYMTLPVIGG
jgi:RNA polymerase sigma factor (sigma-70 family)